MPDCNGSAATELTWQLRCAAANALAMQSMRTFHALIHRNIIRQKHAARGNLGPLLSQEMAAASQQYTNESCEAIMGELEAISLMLDVEPQYSAPSRVVEASLPRIVVQPEALWRAVSDCATSGTAASACALAGPLHLAVRIHLVDSERGSVGDATGWLELRVSLPPGYPADVALSAAVSIGHRLISKTDEVVVQDVTQAAVRSWPQRGSCKHRAAKNSLPWFLTTLSRMLLCSNRRQSMQLGEKLSGLLWRRHATGQRPWSPLLHPLLMPGRSQRLPPAALDGMTSACACGCGFTTSRAL